MSFELPDALATPPPEVRDAVEQVARNLDELAEQRLELRLSIGADARVRVQVRDPGSGVVREISAAHALELLATDPGELASDAD